MHTSSQNDKYQEIFNNKQTIMVIMAHPDDLDVFCGGTVARLVADGKKVISIKVTSGNRGSQDTDVTPEALAETRLNEDAAAMKALGVSPENSINLGVDDGTVENSLSIIERLAYLIRKYQPQLIITTNPEPIIVRHSSGNNWINHRDHRNTAMCALDAAYPYSRDRAFFTEQFGDDTIKPGKCIEFLIADSWSGVDEVLINVEGFIDQKLAAVSSHTSQYSPEAAKNTVEFFTQHEGVVGQYEKFRHVVAD